jgi:asparagine synthase (glutamine-hydrolysing)
LTALAGIWRFSGQETGKDVARMLESQRVYAPDPPALWHGSGISLGRGLFKLLPEDRHDRGPAMSQDGNRILVADVRIDNRDELLPRLGLTQAEGRLMSDAAILLATIDKWGEEALQHAVGDFAFAHWDERKRRLLLARDFMGQRPLHFHAAPGFFAFASMPKGLHALPEIPTGPDQAQVTRFLALMPETGTSTYFDGIKRVPPGHFCIVTADGVTVRRYFNPERTELRLKNPAEYEEAVRESFDRAVAARLRGTEGRVAAHLSGGLDSSTVAATAAQLVGSQGRVCAYTAVPREGYSGYVPRGRFADEGDHAAAVAALYPQMEHVRIRAGHKSPVARLDRNFFLYERPLLNLCNGTWWDAILDDVKARGVSVLLTGQAGNMSFSYTGAESLPDMLARGRLITLFRQLRLLGRNGARFESTMAYTIGPFLPARLWKAINKVRGRHLGIENYSAVNPEAAQAMREEAAAVGLDFNYRPRRDPFGTRLWVLGRVDTGNYNKGTLGGWGIDVRDPTADRRLVELCLSIPADQYLRDGRGRALARSAFSDRLPPQIVNEGRKGIQAIDWHEGLSEARAAVADEVDRASQVAVAGEALDLKMMKQLVDDWPQGQWNSDKVNRRYRLALLRGVSAGHFIRKSAGSNA